MTNALAAIALSAFQAVSGGPACPKRHTWIALYRYIYRRWGIWDANVGPNGETPPTYRGEP